MSAPISYAAFARALKANALGELRGSGPAACARCGADNPLGVVIAYRAAEHCLACAPRERWCPGCEALRPLAGFDVSGVRELRIGSPCIPCRRARELARYHRLQREQPKEVAAEQKCAACDQVLSAEAFHGDQRYSGGLYKVCRKCHGAIKAR